MRLNKIICKLKFNWILEHDYLLEFDTFTQAVNVQVYEEYYTTSLPEIIQERKQLDTPYFEYEILYFIE